MNINFICACLNTSCLNKIIDQRLLFSLQGDVLKLADFGSCKSMYSKQPYTEYISTRWLVKFINNY